MGKDKKEIFVKEININTEEKFYTLLDFVSIILIIFLIGIIHYCVSVFIFWFLSSISGTVFLGALSFGISYFIFLYIFNKIFD